MSTSYLYVNLSDLDIILLLPLVLYFTFQVNVCLYYWCPCILSLIHGHAKYFCCWGIYVVGISPLSRYLRCWGIYTVGILTLLGLFHRWTELFYGNMSSTSVGLSGSKVSLESVADQQAEHHEQVINLLYLSGSCSPVTSNTCGLFYMLCNM